MRLSVAYCTIGFAFTHVRQRRQIDIIVRLHTIVDGQLNGLHCGGNGLCNGAVDSAEISIVRQHIVFCCFCLVQCHFADNGLFVPHLGVVKSSRDAVIRCGEVVLASQPVKGRRHRCVGGSVILLFDFAWNADGQFRRDDFPLCCGSSGVVAGTFDGQGNAVIGIDGLVTAYNIVGGDGFRPAFQHHAGDRRRLLRRVVREFAFFQRDGCALDGLGCNLDGHSSGRGRVFLIALRRSERPFGLIAVACVWLDCAICPCECTLDLIAGCGVFHLARNRALAQRVAVGDAGCGDFTVRYRCDFIHCVEIERQIETLIVVRGDINRDGSNFAGFPAAQCSNRQRQNAIVNRNVINVIPIFKVDRESAIIGYVAIGSLGRVGQKLLGIIGVFQLRAVDHVQCAIPDVRGRVGLGDGESRAAGLRVLLCRGRFLVIVILKHIIAALERYLEGDPVLLTGIRRMDGFFTALLNKVRIRNGVGAARNIDDVRSRKRFECQNICPFFRSLSDCRRAVIGLGNVRGNHDAVDLHRLDLPLHVFDLAGIVAPTLDGQLVAARVGLLRDLHGVVVISTQRFITELDRDRRLLWVAVVGQVTDCDRRAHKADWRNGDGDLGALGIAVAGADEEIGVRSRGEIVGQCVIRASCPFQRCCRRSPLELIPQISKVRSARFAHSAA